ncbi:ABC transporter permease [Streptomyces sp. NBC_01803]|uniref:ABC transporter permease n=1 Tax=Streptomyces sp. NBC_01803 TaxID=2975946 RepID=UPI002DDA00E5|nr:ABC transporter permease [Streptomyces sp. NBC_01803]WSA45223.1 ABC transporter permease [Streptomyces sp. NBC_01803]
MSRLHSWRLALRIARRDALRAKGRSALVVAMIALPILGVTAADLAFRSGELSPAEELTRELGEADARFSVYSSGAPILQAPVGDMTQSTGEEDWGDPVDRPPAEVEEQLTGLLPPGTRLLSDHELLGTVHTESGLLRTDVRELDAADPATEGMLTLLRGRYPERADEVAATQAFLDESGLRVGSEVRFQDDDATFRVTGAYELPDHLDRAQLVALPGAVLPRLDPRAQVAPTFLAVVPDGGVTWDTVLAANEVGLKVDSRSVILDPPPDSEVPMFADGIDIGNVATGADTTLVAGVVTVVSLVILEICLLAGPAFAVGARRSRRQLGLVGANGGDRRHLRAIMLSSGLVLGLAAAVIGIAGGIALALAAHPLIENQSHQRFGPWDFRVAELAGIGALAVLVGLLAAVIPAINAARSSVLESLTGRRGTRRASRVLPTIGLTALVLGASLAIVGGLAFDGTVVVAIGAVTAELGLVALTPVLVGAVGRLGRRLPLSGRLALRDAARNRGRTAPAVAAVLAAVAGTIAVSTVITSDEAQDRAQYEAALPDGVVTIGASDTEQRDQLDEARAAAERELPVARRVDVSQVHTGNAACYPGARSAGEEDCGYLELVVPPERICPLWAPDADLLPVEERRELNGDPRCVDEGSLGYGELTFWVAGPELLTVLGADDDQVRRAGEALDRGEAVVFGDRYVSRAGEVTLNLWDTSPEWAEDGTPATPPDRSATFPAHRVDGDGYGMPALISPAAAEAAGLLTGETNTFYSTTRMPTGAERQAFDGALGALGVAPWTYIETGYHGDTGATLLILALAALVITLGAAGIATGLAQADSEADLATLASVGASPRVRRTLSGLQCGLIAAMGVLLGAVSGLIPSIGLRLAQHRADVAMWERGWNEGWASGVRPDLFIALPWATFAQLIVVVPLIACALAALLTRSRIHLARRAG